jgi:hypothetical protein
LLWHLGYDNQGNHPDGRRLVFLGDLVDRGPNSPAVLELVKEFVGEGLAQCILGNHELNILRGKRKDGNNWFTCPDDMGKYPFKAVNSEQKEDFLNFLLTLPLALEREDLRVVHASWHRDSIQKLRKLEGRPDALDAYRRFEENLALTEVPKSMTDVQLQQELRDSSNKPPFMPDLAEHDTSYQMGNPVRVLTSGEEAPASEPFWAGGRWRMVARQKWWESYDDDTPVIVGHYWRRFGDVPSEISDKGGPDLFEGIEPHHWMGKNKNVYCVDFSVGLRHRARADKSSKYLFKLAAVRWPERSVMYDDGSSVSLQ